MESFKNTISTIQSFNAQRADVRACIARMHFVAVERKMEYADILKSCNAFSPETLGLAADWMESNVSVSDRARNRAISAMRTAVLGLHK